MTAGFFNSEEFNKFKTFTSKIHHCDKTLFDHLNGVYNILKNDLNQPEYVCLAGLFHSIYDTEYFKISSSYNRNNVKKLIGSDAEYLVYEFCRVEDRVNKLIFRRENWNDQTYINLLQIEVANMLEQRYYTYEVQLLNAILKQETKNK